MKHDITTHLTKAREEAFAAHRKLNESWDRFREHESLYVEAIRSIDEALELLSRARSVTSWLEENVK